MQITRTSGFSGITRTLDLNVTDEQIAAWKGGELVQHAFAHLSAGEREFLVTGVTEKEWDDVFAKATKD